MFCDSPVLTAYALLDSAFHHCSKVLYEATIYLVPWIQLVSLQDNWIPVLYFVLILRDEFVSSRTVNVFLIFAKSPSLRIPMQMLLFLMPTETSLENMKQHWKSCTSKCRTQNSHLRFLQFIKFISCLFINDISAIRSTHWIKWTWIVYQ